MKLRTPADIKALRASVSSLPVVRSRIAKRVAEEFTKLARQEFDAQMAPDGKAWKPGRRGRKVTLDRTGRLRSAATTYTATGTTVRASALSVPYAKFQLARSFIPSSKKLPASWAEAAKRIAREEINAHFQGLR